MARRLVEANMVLDLSMLDEPVYAMGSLVFPLRRLFWAGAAIAASALGLALGLSTEPRLLPLGPLELGPGFLLPLPIAALALAMALQNPRPVSLEAELLDALRARSLRRPKPRAEGFAEDYMIQVDRDLGVAEVEVSGYAIDPATGRPVRDVLVVVEGLGEHSAEVDERGRYRARLELQPGTYTIKILGEGLELRRLRVKVV